MDQRIRDIINYVQRCEGEYRTWYCGIASNPKDRIFNQHNVAENGNWIFRNFENSELARLIEKYFLENLGFDGGPSGGDYSTVYVYVYKKTTDTIE